MKKFDVISQAKSPFLKNISDKADKADKVTRQENPKRLKSTVRERLPPSREAMAGRLQRYTDDF